jgi:hypothetical protein
LWKIQKPQKNKHPMNRFLKSTTTILSALAVMATSSPATSVTWDGGGSDGLWATPTNWNPDGVPLAADNVVVGSSATVTGATNVFRSLAIQAGASVTLAQDTNSTNNIAIDGTLSRTDGVLRLGGAYLDLTATGSLGAGVNWLDTFNSTMSFTDGAAFGNPNMGFEHKGTNVFNYTLSATGFKTLIAGGLYSGTYYGGTAATWSNVTYNIDVSDYDLSNGTVVTLVDYASGTLPGNFATDAHINIYAGGSGLNPKVTFNTSTSALIVTFPKVWAGGASGSWATATNWDPQQIPLAADDVIVGSNAAVTDGTDVFSTLEIQAGAKVTMGPLSNGFLSGKTLNVAGTLDYVGVFRPYSTLNLSGGLGSNITFLDAGNATMSFTDGASFGNPGMSFQQHTNIFNYTLSATGFTTLRAAHMYGDNWSNVTYNIDISNYNLSSGTIVTLAQYGGTSIAGNFADAHVNIIAGSSGLTPIVTYSSNALIVQFTKVWDGGASGSWATATNWNPDQIPLAADKVQVGSNAAVADGTSTFSDLEIQAGATVTMVTDMSSSNYVKVAGTLNRAGVHRLNGAKIDLTGTGSLGAGITWFDTNGCTINFTDGASFGNPSMTFEHKATNTFGYTLSTTGFTTIIAGNLYSGSGATWANATYNINISAYDISHGGTITLVDYSGHSAAFDGTFNPTVNINAGSSGLTATLAFDKVNSKLVLTIPTGNAYDSWVTTNGVTGGKLGDDDNDGLKNLEEYAFGTNPRASNGSPIHNSINGSGNIELSATKGSAAGADSATTYGVEASFDLLTWTTNGVTITTNDATHLVASYTGPPAAPAGKVFLRVVISN